MMKIKMHNVGFGDFFILEENNSFCFVDCGSLDKSKQIGNLALAKLRALPSDRKLTGIITHFHEDHYNGYKVIAQVQPYMFDKVLVPYVTIDSKTNRAINLELAMYFYVFLNKNTQTWKLASNTLNIVSTLTNLVKDVTKIRFVSNGDNFTVGSTKFKIIWPDRIVKHDNRLIEYLEELDEQFSNESNYSSFRELTVELLNNFTNLQNRLISQTDDIQTINQLIEQHKNVLGRINDLSESMGATTKAEFISQSLKYYGTKLFSQSNNSTSIVFHDAPSKGKTPHRLLMTGDIERNIINSVLRKRFGKTYKIIKSPHHGTETHYSALLPTAQIMLISTGERRGYKKICSQYSTHPHKNTPRHCTDGMIWCDSLDSGASCTRPHCHNIMCQINC